MDKLHLALDVPDLDGAVAFYRTLFGRGPDKLRDEYARFDLDNPPVVFSLNKAERGGVSHLGIRTANREDLAERTKALEAASIPVAPEEGVTCCYAVQDKGWVSDPIGLSWEVYTVLEDSDLYRDTETNCCPDSEEPEAAASCCG